MATTTVIPAASLRRSARRTARGKDRTRKEGREGRVAARRAVPRCSWASLCVEAYSPERTVSAASSARWQRRHPQDRPDGAAVQREGGKREEPGGRASPGNHRGNLAAGSAGRHLRRERPNPMPQPVPRMPNRAGKGAGFGVGFAPKRRAQNAAGSRGKARCRIKKAPAGAGAFRNAGGRVLSRARRGTRYW